MRQGGREACDTHMMHYFLQVLDDKEKKVNREGNQRDQFQPRVQSFHPSSRKQNTTETVTGPHSVIQVGEWRHQCVSNTSRVADKRKSREHSRMQNRVAKNLRAGVHRQDRGF